jgi:hypothetical protein
LADFAVKGLARFNATRIHLAVRKPRFERHFAGSSAIASPREKPEKVDKLQATALDLITLNGGKVFALRRAAERARRLFAIEWGGYPSVGE